MNGDVEGMGMLSWGRSRGRKLRRLFLRDMGAPSMPGEGSPCGVASDVNDETDVVDGPPKRPSSFAAPFKDEGVPFPFLSEPVE